MDKHTIYYLMLLLHTLLTLIQLDQTILCLELGGVVRRSYWIDVQYKILDMPKKKKKKIE